MHTRLQVPRRGFLASSLAAVAGGKLLRRQAFAQATVAATTKDLIVHQEVPLNAEPALEKLVRDWITPIKHFYVRSHAPVPDVDPKTYRLRVEGLVERSLTLSLDELTERFTRVETTATLTCAGNRRAEYNEIEPVGGVQWQAGAIGNARWGGVDLAEVLRAAGLQASARHVWFEGVDEHEKNGRNVVFGGSIPLDKAMSSVAEVPGAMLATHMNGEELPPDHGYPLRTVVPGYIGARSVKWLGRIVVSDRPSSNHYVAHAYKLVSEDAETAWSEQEPLYEYLMNSVIATPTSEFDVSVCGVALTGFALPPGDGMRRLAKVEVSTDGGASWRPAKFTSPEQAFCWRLWRAAAPIDGETQSILVRATDSAGDAQPREMGWNLKGYMNNSWFEAPLNARS